MRDDFITFSEIYRGQLLKFLNRKSYNAYKRFLLKHIESGELLAEIVGEGARTRYYIKRQDFKEFLQSLMPDL